MLKNVIFDVSGPVMPEMTPVDGERVKSPPRVDKGGDMV